MASPKEDDMRGSVKYRRKLDKNANLVEVAEYYLDGKRVSLVKFKRAFPDRPVGQVGGTPKSGWPIYSQAVAVLPHQRQEAIAVAKAKGVPTEVMPDGKIVFTSARHQRAYLRAHAMHNNDDNE